MSGFTESRLDRLRNLVAAAELDALLITQTVNVGYITGFTGSAGYALVGPSLAVLITDPRYTLRVHQECPGFEVYTTESSAGYAAGLKDLLEGRPRVKRVGFESTRVTVSFWEQLKRDSPSIDWQATKGMVEDMRSVKDTGEVDAIRAAVAVAESAFVSVKPLLRPGVSERDFAIDLDFAMRRGGADAIAFETIVASGPQSAHPHHQPNNRVIAPGDWVTVDWGARLGGYCSDMTRTFLMRQGGASVDEQRHVYAIVLEAQRRAIAAIKPGKTGKEIDDVAREYIAAAGYAGNFGHSLGHALGRQVHDGTGLSARSGEFTLKPGMVMTVEPGIYIEHWGGIRIEENIVVTESGCEVLTHLPNELEIL
jgi:Xaa-Pro aminopeptidase